MLPGVDRSGPHTAGSFPWLESAQHTLTHSRKSSFTFVSLLDDTHILNSERTHFMFSYKVPKHHNQTLLDLGNKVKYNVGSVGVAEPNFNHGVSAGTYKETEKSQNKQNSHVIVLYFCVKKVA